MLRAVAEQLDAVMVDASRSRTLVELARAAAVETAGDASAVGRTSASTSQRGPGRHPRLRVRAARATADGCGRSTLARPATRRGDRVRGRTCSRPTTRCSPRRGCPMASGCSPETSSPAWCCRYIADDPRLVPGYTATGDEDPDAWRSGSLALDASACWRHEARDDVAERWYRGSHGPTRSVRDRRRPRRARRAPSGFRSRDRCACSSARARTSGRRPTAAS